MVEKLIEEIKKKYNLEIDLQIKFSKVYTVTFKIEGKEISFTYMYDSLSSFADNLKELEHKVNTEIIDYYKRKENK